MITTGGKIYQWDTGRVIEVYHLQNSTVSEVHVFNGTTDNALVLELQEVDGKTVAKIPDELLQFDYNLDIYAVVSDSFGKYTTEHLNTRVFSRPKPIDYIYTESEVKRFEHLEKRMEELEKRGVPIELVEQTVQEYIENNDILNPLPQISEEDEGKVLMAIGGEWKASELPIYKGTYEATPKMQSSTLETRGKFMQDDVTINPVPVYEVSNTTGGTTVYIAKES